MFSQFAEKVTFVNSLPLLTEATSDDGEPTPGFLLGKIRDVTFQSHSCCKQLSEYILHRLSKSSTFVKIKVLKIIIYLVQNGDKSFRQNLRGNDGPIKTALLHSGPPDPLLGNTQYKEVQRLAQEALDILYDSDLIKEEEIENFSPVESPKFYMGGMGAGGRNTGKYDGFGNTPKDQEGTVTDKMLDYIGRLIHPTSEHVDEVIRSALHSSPGEYQAVPVTGPPSEQLVVVSQQMQKVAVGRGHVPGRAGGGWDSDENDTGDDKEELGIYSRLSSVPNAGKESPTTLDHQAVSEQDVTVESSLRSQNLIRQFCEIKTFPKICDLDEINARFGSLDCVEVIKALDQFLSEHRQTKDSEVYMMRALLLLEWLQHNGLKVHSENLMNTIDLIAGPESTISEAVQSKARKIKLILQNTSYDNMDVSSS